MAQPESGAFKTPADSNETIRLDQFLKLTGRARSGGEAKHRIQAGEVTVNGEVETHRSRKLSRGDRVGVDGEVIEVELSE